MLDIRCAVTLSARRDDNHDLAPYPAGNLDSPLRWRRTHKIPEGDVCHAAIRELYHRDIFSSAAACEAYSPYMVRVAK